MVHPRFLKSFESITVLTYLFKRSLMDVMFDIHEIKYNHVSVFGTFPEFMLKPYDGANGYLFKDLINIHKHRKHNDIGSKKRTGRRGRPSTPLCRGWMLTTSGKPRVNNCNDLKKVMTNVSRMWERNDNNFSRESLMWTCHKDAIDSIAYRNFNCPDNSNWVAKNRRGTNMYSHMEYLMYPVDILFDPKVREFLRYSGYSLTEIDAMQDVNALSVMIQWIWRSRIRNNKQITLWVPSEHMRTLLMDWLGYEDKERF